MGKIQLECICDEINSRHCQYHQELADLQAAYDDAIKMLEKMAGALVISTEIFEARIPQTMEMKPVYDAINDYRKFKEGLGSHEEDHDPTPYCAGCHAKTKAQCKCGETAENN